jgi:hypothetical protein
VTDDPAAEIEYTPPGQAFVCEAYPPEAAQYGVICFFADRGTRNCGSAEECAASVAGARKVLWQRMNEQAAHNPGDETWKSLAETFTSPGQIMPDDTDLPPALDGGSG